MKPSSKLNWLEATQPFIFFFPSSSPLPIVLGTWALVPRCFWDHSTIRETGLEMPTTVTESQALDILLQHGTSEKKKTHTQNPVRVLQMSQEAAGDALFGTLGKSWKADHTEAGKSPRSHCQLDPREGCSWTMLLAVTSEQDSNVYKLRAAGSLMLSGVSTHSNLASSCDSFQCFRRVKVVAKWGEDKNVLPGSTEKQLLKGKQWFQGGQTNMLSKEGSLPSTTSFGTTHRSLTDYHLSLWGKFLKF